jgi:ribonucleoside-diphosphate reductase alpha chain
MATEVKKKKSQIAKYEGPEYKKKLEIKRHFTIPFSERYIQDPYDSVEWGTRDAVAGDYEQKGVEAPLCWSDNAVGIVAKLYFATIDGQRESSIKTLIKRVVTKITDEGEKHGYFDEVDACIFKDELTYILVNQIAAFNTPVWLNLGVPGRKACCSACYLLNVEDTMFGKDSITDWWRNEAAIFKSGAGSGVNLSKIRGSMEPISVGGIASGPVSFMRVADANAGTIKSGSVARRAAKLVCLDVDHPDILDFIDSKVREDERMRALMAAGVNLDPSTPEGEKNIAECTSFQNANISVRLSDKFMKAVEEDEEWQFQSRIDNSATHECSARDLLLTISEAAWKCADPGVMFDDTINKWHTTPSFGRISTSNPCCEVHQNINTSCNLASLNLVKFLNKDNSFRFEDFNQAVDIMITAMDITCSFSELPTKKLEENTRNLRQLGLGYSNLGAALMIQGMPYDSDEGRDWAASVTSLMTGRAYRRSAELALQLGPFLYYEDNSFIMKEILSNHQESIPKISGGEIWGKSEEIWSKVSNSFEGFRNSQVTVIAPTGTISFMMDCDTTGAEPAYSLVTYKKLASGGNMTLVNNSVARSLQVQGFLNSEIKKIEEDGLSHPIFSTPHFQTAAGDNTISPMGHLKMLASIQPHISGAISKTVNIPESSTVEDIYNLYLEAWKMGIKCLAVYRDGSKATQVLSSKKDTSAPNSVTKEFPFTAGDTIYNSQKEWDEDQVAISEYVVETEKESRLEKPQDEFEAMGVTENSPDGKNQKNVLQNKWKADITEYVSPIPWKDKSLPLKAGESLANFSRKRLNDDRASLTHKFNLGQHEGYITAGMYDDGTLGEIFLSGIGKEGSTLKGVLEGWAIAISMGLQYGVPLEKFAEKFSNMNFEPNGFTNNKEIRSATSILDYVMRWLISKFGDKDQHKEFGLQKDYKVDGIVSTVKITEEPFNKEEIGYINPENIYERNNISSTNSMTGKLCNCGAIMNRTGTCYSCPSCGNTSGCG